MKTTATRLMMAATILQAVGTPFAHAETGDAKPNAPAERDVTKPAQGIKLSVGDVVQVVMPGEPVFDAPFRVDRAGRIELPEVGGVDVVGLTLPQAKERVKSALSSSYRDVTRFNLVLKERKLLLTVLGYVRNPGNVELPENANVQQAIVAAGGLLQGAQLDRMQLRHTDASGKQVSETFDYKKYLDTGDNKSLPTLHALDEIFIPASPGTGNVEVNFDPKQLQAAGDAADKGSSVRVMGEVTTQASFSWKEDMHVMDALMRANGVTRYASIESIHVLGEGEPKIFNLKKFTETNDPALNFVLPKGATIFVQAEVQAVKTGRRTVYAMGEVSKPGAYETQDGATFFDILSNAGGPTRFADTKQVRIIRANGAVDAFDLAQYTQSGGGKIPVINGGDAIFVPEKINETGNTGSAWLRTPSDRAVRVMGSVRAPGRLEWSDEMSILDLLAQVGGANDKGDLSKVEIVGKDGKPQSFDLQSFLDNGGLTSKLPKITGGATVTVPQLPDTPNDARASWTKLSPDRAIHVFGAVGKPGRYAITPDMSFLDLISAVDGPTPAADILNIRINHRGEGHDHIEKVNLARYFETGDDSLLPKVRPGDVVYVPDRNRNWLENSPATTVRVLGAVGKPGRYQITDGMTLLDLLAEAGGPSSNALQDRIVIANMTAGEKNAKIFDLPDFARTADFTKLPVVRAGDTVYVPNTEMSDWNIFFGNARDVLSIVAVAALLKGL